MLEFTFQKKEKNREKRRISLFLKNESKGLGIFFS